MTDDSKKPIPTPPPSDGDHHTLGVPRVKPSATLRPSVGDRLTNGKKK